MLTLSKSLTHITSRASGDAKKKSRDKMKVKENSKERLKYLRRKEKSGTLSKEEKKEMKKLSQKK